MKSTFKDIILKSSVSSFDVEKYNSQEFEEHLIKFKPCLDQINSSSLDIQKNLVRITNLNTANSVESETESILDCLVTEGKENVKFLIEKNVTAINEVPVSFEKVKIHHEELVLLCKTGRFKDFFKDSLLNSQNYEIKDLSLLGDKIVENVTADSILSFLKILNLSQHQEFISTICCEHKILLIIGSVHYLPYMFTLYKKGFFTGLIKDVIIKLNFKQMKLFVFKPNILIPTGALIISGILFNFKVDGSWTSKLLQHFQPRDLIKTTTESANEYIKQFSPGGSVGELITTFSRVGNQLGFAFVKVGGSFFKGVTVGLADNIREICTFVAKSTKN
jgi:hypothetical protein